MDIGDRMKAYEACSSPQLTRRMPLIIRIDGRTFHTLTAKMEAFDDKFNWAMRYAAVAVAEDCAGFVCAYIQSDEVSFLLQDWAELGTQAWFGKDLSKIVSASAATASIAFSKSIELDATFDSRAFVLPREEVSNYFLWRAKDAERNSLSKYARCHFSHKDLIGKGREEMHEMLHGVGKNWATDLCGWKKNGSFVRRGLTDDGRHVFTFNDDVRPTYADVSAFVEEAIKLATTPVLVEA